MARILVVEDSHAVRDAVAEFLRRDGHDVAEAPDARSARRELEAGDPELCILDIMLPEGDGFDLAREIRSRTGASFLFLTARDDEASRIAGLELGADDYVVKPFSPRELVLRVRAILRRARSANRTYVCRRNGDALEVDADSHTVRLCGEPVTLTPTEWRLLERLCRVPNTLVDKTELLEHVFGYAPETASRTVDTHIKNLRAKVGDGWIETVRGFGYLLRTEG